MNKQDSLHSIWLENDNKRESKRIELCFDSIQNSQEENDSRWRPMRKSSWN